MELGRRKFLGLGVQAACGLTLINMTEGLPAALETLGLSVGDASIAEAAQTPDVLKTFTDEVGPELETVGNNLVALRRRGVRGVVPILEQEIDGAGENPISPTLPQPDTNIWKEGWPHEIDQEAKYARARERANNEIRVLDHQTGEYVSVAEASQKDQTLIGNLVITHPGLVNILPPNFNIDNRLGTVGELGPGGQAILGTQEFDGEYFGHPFEGPVALGMKLLTSEASDEVIGRLKLVATKGQYAEFLEAYTGAALQRLDMMAEAGAEGTGITSTALVGEEMTFDPNNLANILSIRKAMNEAQMPSEIGFNIEGDYSPDDTFKFDTQPLLLALACKLQNDEIIPGPAITDIMSGDTTRYLETSLVYPFPLRIGGGGFPDQGNLLEKLEDETAIAAGAMFCNPAKKIGERKNRDLKYRLGRPRLFQ
jgi:hypothetical protein